MVCSSRNGKGVDRWYGRSRDGWQVLVGGDREDGRRLPCVGSLWVGVLCQSGGAVVSVCRISYLSLETSPWWLVKVRTLQSSFQMCQLKNRQLKVAISVGPLGLLFFSSCLLVVLQKNEVFF